LSGKAAALATRRGRLVDTELALPDAEAVVHANGIDLCYQSLGDPGAPVILLIMGLGMQLIAWPEAFCASLVDRGFRVIRFDNRDVGHSTHVCLGTAAARAARDCVRRAGPAGAFRRIA
jgi:pimeloyl-ACP methyl ester carboxylesterase